MDTFLLIFLFGGMILIARHELKKISYWNELVEAKLCKVAGEGALIDNADRYVIAYHPVYRAIGSAGGFFMTCIAVFATFEDGFDPSFMILSVPMIIFGVACFAGLCVWEIIVNGEQIVYRGYLGKVYHYTFSDITSYAEKPNGAIVMYSGKKRLFTIDNNLVEQMFFKNNLRRHKIPATVSGMTLDKFTLKPRMVYFVVAWMCLSFPLIMLGIMIVQDDWSYALIGITLLANSPIIILLLDLYLDRFTVEGTRVRRRRGLRLVKFDLKDVEYTVIKKNLFRENMQFYINGKKVTHVWTANFPIHLLESKLKGAGVRRRRKRKR